MFFLFFKSPSKCSVNDMTHNLLSICMEMTKRSDLCLMSESLVAITSKQELFLQ